MEMECVVVFPHQHMVRRPRKWSRFVGDAHDPSKFSSVSSIPIDETEEMECVAKFPHQPMDRRPRKLSRFAGDIKDPLKDSPMMEELPLSPSMLPVDLESALYIHKKKP